MVKNCEKLFDYGSCSKCYCIKNDTRVALSHVLPPQICEDISDYNDYCSGCSKARYNEQKVIEWGMTLGWCKMEMRLYHFCMNNPNPFLKNAPKTVKVRTMNRLIDKFENTDKLKNKILKKYFKDYCGFITNEVIPNLYKLEVSLPVFLIPPQPASF